MNVDQRYFKLGVLVGGRDSRGGAALAKSPVCLTEALKIICHVRV